MYRSAAATQQDVYNVRNKIFLFYWMKRLKKEREESVDGILMVNR